MVVIKIFIFIIDLKHIIMLDMIPSTNPLLGEIPMPE